MNVKEMKEIISQGRSRNVCAVREDGILLEQNNIIILEKQSRKIDRLTIYE